MKITAKVEPTNVFMRSHCGVCGGCTEKEGVLVTFYVDGEEWTHMCFECVESGDFHGRLQERAREVRERADCLQRLVDEGQWAVDPSRLRDEIATVNRLGDEARKMEDEEEAEKVWRALKERPHVA